MAVIAHISDIHFPLVQQGVSWALLRTLREAKPKLVVVSGDLTQRGREGQYQKAVAFLDELPKPYLVVPGNHDVPLYDVMRRFFLPTERFTRLVTADLSPVYQDEQMIVVGANSTRAFTLSPRSFWKNGTLSRKQLDLVAEQFAAAPPELLKVFVMHHPLINPHDDGPRDTARHHRRIIASLSEIGVDVVLSGHLHKAYARYAPGPTNGAKRLLCVQSGTSASSRHRGENNAFNLLHWDGSLLGIKVMRFGGEKFELEREQQFRLR